MQRGRREKVSVMRKSVTKQEQWWQSDVHLQRLINKPDSDGTENAVIRFNWMNTICFVVTLLQVYLHLIQTNCSVNQAVNTHAQQPYLLLRVPAGHLLLELLLQLLAGADGLLVAREVGQLLQPGVGEVLRKMLAAPFVGRKEFLLGRDING